MKSIEGRRVYTDLDEMAAPEHTALVIVDMQNDYLTKGGSIDSQHGERAMVRAKAALVDQISALIAAARAAGVVVVYVQQTQLPGLRNESPNWMHLLYERMSLSPDVERCRLGTWGWEIVPDLAPLDTDVVVRKWRSSGFAGTNLDLVLRANRIETLVVCGVATEGCVMATALDAFFTDYYVVLARDAVAGGTTERHDAAMVYLEQWLNWLPSSDEVIAAWGVAAKSLHPAPALAQH